MSAAQPMVSVVLPVYNGERFLAEAVANVRQQNYMPLEIIIVDDGSTDGTAALVKTLGDDIRYAYQPNAGPAAARNVAIEMSKGDIIAFIDVDDLWPLDKLAVQMLRFERNPALEIVLGRIQVIELIENARPRVRVEHPDQSVLNVHLGSGLFKRDLFDRIGFFDTDMLYGEDVDWLLRALEADVALTIVKETTLYYRIHESNMTNDGPTTAYYMFKALKRSLDRRRAADGTVRPLPIFTQFEEGYTDGSSHRKGVEPNER